MGTAPCRICGGPTTGPAGFTYGACNKCTRMAIAAAELKRQPGRAGSAYAAFTKPATDRNYCPKCGAVGYRYRDACICTDVT